MLRRLSNVAMCILVFPMLVSLSHTDHAMVAVPSGSVAFAGHTTMGGWCGCGTPECECDPGEHGGNLNAPTPDRMDYSAPVRSSAGSSADHGAGMLMLALVFFLWTRLRA